MNLLPKKVADLKEYTPNAVNCKTVLDANECYCDFPKEIKTSIAKKLADVPFNRYPDPYATELCSEFSKVFSLCTQNIAAGNGSDEIISVLIFSFLQKGEKVLLINPDFSMYEFYAKICEIETVCQYKEAGFAVSLTRALKKIDLDRKIKMVIFSNPCNPTGQLIPKQEILNFARKTGILTLVDEAYMDFDLNENSVLAEAAEIENLLVLKTLSKAFGAAAARIGFLIAEEKIISAFKKVKSPYNVNAFSQVIGTEILKNIDYVEKNVKEMIKNRDFLYTELSKSPLLECYKTHTNFVFVKAGNAHQIADFLQSKGIKIRVLLGEYLRITTGSKEENQLIINTLKEGKLL